MLHREARALAIRRIEESARTAADFENVLYWWDILDTNMERKERVHEVRRSAVPLERGADEIYLSSKISYDVVLMKLLLASKFIDVTFDHLGHPRNLAEIDTEALWQHTCIQKSKQSADDSYEKYFLKNRVRKKRKTNSLTDNK